MTVTLNMEATMKSASVTSRRTLNGPMKSYSQKQYSCTIKHLPLSLHAHRNNPNGTAAGTGKRRQTQQTKQWFVCPFCWMRLLRHFRYFAEPILLLRVGSFGEVFC